MLLNSSQEVLQRVKPQTRLSQSLQQQPEDTKGLVILCSVHIASYTRLDVEVKKWSLEKSSQKLIIRYINLILIVEKLWNILKHKIKHSFETKNEIEIIFLFMN